MHALVIKAGQSIVYVVQADSQEEADGYKQGFDAALAQFDPESTITSEVVEQVNVTASGVTMRSMAQYSYRMVKNVLPGQSAAAMPDARGDRVIIPAIITHR